MKKTFVETIWFTRWVAEQDVGWDQVLAKLQFDLMADPNLGDPMIGCGGLRKVRVRDPRRQKGKRGGARVVYLHVPQVDRIYLVDVYDKGEKDDLSAAERKLLAQLAKALKSEVIRHDTKKPTHDE